MPLVYREECWTLKGDTGTANTPDLFITRRIPVGSAEVSLSRLVVQRIEREVTIVVVHFRLDYADESPVLIQQEPVRFFCDWLQVQWTPILGRINTGYYDLSGPSTQKLNSYTPKRAADVNQVTKLDDVLLFGDPLQVAVRAQGFGVPVKEYLRRLRNEPRRLLVAAMTSKIDTLLQTLVVPWRLPSTWIGTDELDPFEGSLKARFRWR
ncbi:hypothetical protein HGA91_04935 [candidate division WWE3 bacterium]|nr:hypothetical protein [candidate division WWE3 bacterium]